MGKKASRKTTTKKSVETLRHADSKRTNIPTAEQQSVMETEEKYSIRVAYERRNRDLDPQLVWRGKDEQDAGPLVAKAPPLYIQENVHPKVLIDDLMRRTDDLKEKGIRAIGDHADLEDLYNTERHLLYIACTRARDHLLITGVDPVSEFLEDCAVIDDRQ